MVEEAQRDTAAHAGAHEHDITRPFAVSPVDRSLYVAPLGSPVRIEPRCAARRFFIVAVGDHKRREVERFERREETQALFAPRAASVDIDHPRRAASRNEPGRHRPVIGGKVHFLER